MEEVKTTQLDYQDFKARVSNTIKRYADELDEDIQNALVFINSLQRIGEANDYIYNIEEFFKITRSMLSLVKNEAELFKIKD